MKHRSLRLLIMLLALCIACASCGGRARAADSTLPGGLIRIGGSDRFSTSALIAAKGWERADCVVLASADSYADALAGAPLARALDAPVLLVRGNELDPSVRERIQTLSPKNIYILGGTSAVGEGIEKSFVSGSDIVSGCDVERISGKDRFETGINIAHRLEELRGAPSMIFAVCANNYPDALAGGSAAALLGCPVIYVDEKADMTGLAEFVSYTGCDTAAILGGTAAVPESAERKLRQIGLTEIERIAGSNRYQTALETVKRFNALYTGSAAIIATGESYPDALSGSVLAAKLASPLVLVNNTTTVRGLYEYLEGRGVSEMYVLGGTSAVSEYTLGCLRSNTVMTTTTLATTAATAPTSAAASIGKNASYVYSPNYKSKYYIVMFEGNQSVCVYGKDAKGKYSVLVRSMKCSSGKKGTRTPKGLYEISNKYRWRLMMGDVYAQYACRFNGNVLFHSVIYEKMDASTMKMQSYRSLGDSVSHGCVRLCVRDAKWIYDNVPEGTQVRVVTARGPSGMAVPALKSGSRYYGWDPTDPDPANPYNK